MAVSRSMNRAARYNLPPHAPRPNDMGFRETLFLKVWAFAKVPMIWLTRASVVEAREERCVIRIPFRRRNRNHLHSIYFGVLCIGADVAGGFLAMRQIEAGGGGVALIFKDFRAEFLKRAEGDVYFACDDGESIGALVRKARASGERENMTVRVTATVPDKLGDEPVARFELTLSLKRRDG
jgi:acyl-coenzyme A thioesterase PaaI-like protein